MQQLTTQRHLLDVWNQWSWQGRLETHAELLRHFIVQHRRGKLPEDQAYVWWGAIRSEGEYKPFTHLSDLLSMQLECGDPEREVQLYLTDRDSMFVAHLRELTDMDVRASRLEREHMPPQYVERECEVECWFRISDIRLIALDVEGTVSAAGELTEARASSWHLALSDDMEVPMVVTRPDGRRFFEPVERAKGAKGRRWVEVEAKQLASRPRREPRSFEEAGW